jgi:HD-GYP domain-containing protein (c-di-GMP phosphodiesterase class II)
MMRPTNQTLDSSVAFVFQEPIKTMQTRLADVIEALHRMSILHSPSNEEHSSRTKLLAARIGQKLIFSNDAMILLNYAADIHDFGKLFIDPSILNKSGQLNKAQRAQIEKHCELGFEALEPFGLPQEIMDTVLFHQERWDGSGYPRKLKGDQIPLYARIVGVADMWDALNTDRPYRVAYKAAKAMEIMTQCSVRFDPQIYSIFLGIMREDALP